MKKDDVIGRRHSCSRKGLELLEGKSESISAE